MRRIVDYVFITYQKQLMQQNTNFRMFLFCEAYPYKYWSCVSCHLNVSGVFCDLVRRSVYSTSVKTRLELNKAPFEQWYMVVGSATH